MHVVNEEGQPNTISNSMPLSRSRRLSNVMTDVRVDTTLGVGVPRPISPSFTIAFGVRSPQAGSSRTGRGRHSKAINLGYPQPMLNLSACRRPALAHQVRPQSCRQLHVDSQVQQVSQSLAIIVGMQKPQNNTLGGLIAPSVLDLHGCTSGPEAAR